MGRPIAARAPGAKRIFRPKGGAGVRPAAAPSRRRSARAASPAGPRRRAHGRRHTAPGRGVAPALALPQRIVGAPFARATRARAGGVLDALLAGRGWIALIFVLLAGIVFFNVDLLQMNREIALDAEKAAALKRTNGRLRLELARLGSSERIQEAAAGIGLVLPAPGEVRYLRTHPGVDARRAAKRITEPSGLFSPTGALAEPPLGSTTAPAGTTTPGAIPPTGVTPPAATTPPAVTTTPGVAGTPPTTGAPPVAGVPPTTAVPAVPTTPGAIQAPVVPPATGAATPPAAGGQTGVPTTGATG